MDPAELAIKSSVQFLLLVMRYFGTGGLVHADARLATKTAQEALTLWELGGRGCLHAQSRRFLDARWTGLRNNAEHDPNDPSLRSFVQRMANGETVLQMHAEDPVACAPLLKWLGGLRLVTQRNENMTPRRPKLMRL